MKKLPHTKVLPVVGRLWRYLARRRAVILVAFLVMILSNLLALAVPLLSGAAIDAIGTKVGGVNFSAVFYNCIWMLVCYAVSSLLSYLLSVLLIHLSQRVVQNLRQDIFQNLMTLPVSYFDKHPVGNIISCICYDVDTIGACLSTDLIQISTSVITVLGSLVMLLLLSPPLSVVMLVTVPITTLFSRWQMKRMHPLFRRRSKKLGELGSLIEESVTAGRAVSAYSCEAAMLRRFEWKNTEAMDAFYEADAKSVLLGPMVNFINNISLAVGSVLGALLCLSQQLTLGAVSSFILYSRKFSGPIREAANIVSEIQAAAAAAERVFRLIDEEPEAPDKENALSLSQVEGRVGLEGVSFHYNKGEEVLHNINIDIPKGSIVAIVGPTGAGKTTIVNLLMRFYDVQSGRITVDGTDIQDIMRRELRMAYAMVLQDSWLFSGTVYENIAYGNDNATPQQVIAAAKAAKIHKHILSLPQGYDTLLEDGGENFSKGQRQLLTIARAMLMDANMLILDEATSNVDSGTELEINEAMHRLMKDKTCFIIAHRLSTIENADLILVMDQGRLAEQGTHHELLQNGDIYYKLYCSQFKIYK
jgi:ATP-binding cassette subfamily B multidrug efflux pump